MAPRRSTLRAGLALIALLALYGWSQLGSPEAPDVASRAEPSAAAPAGRSATPPAPPTRGAPSDSDASILRAFRARQSDQIVTSGGRVRATLPDDNEGSRHQRFIVELASGHTVLIAHNIDLSQRVPLNRGDRVRFKGEYEWNAKGGVIHWTHHDPQRRHPGGWIEHDGRRYE